MSLISQWGGFEKVIRFNGVEKKIGDVLFVDTGKIKYKPFL